MHDGIDQGGNEAIRLATLKSYDIMDTPNEAEFDEIVAEAVVAMNTPIALISLVDGNRQWFKARIGLDQSETDRSLSFCAHAIAGAEIFTVEDATHDPRFQHNPLVTGDPGIRFYAGAPLTAANGMRIGTLCVIDRKPRPPLDMEEARQLSCLAERAMTALERRKPRTYTILDQHPCYGRDR
ncbi:GAF domain-containing protein [Sphingomonas sp.]|jgi:GAF domain-containing protein|uniref:GAF domain-containing protein n=1 Tax=Sphingomonas sp. TaxID=28214 RepID=UPI002EDB55B9